MPEHNLPLTCPSCQQQLHVTHMKCTNCETKIEGNYILPSLLELTAEEQRLMLEFVKNNGSPQRLSKVYNLSYPSIRTRLDKLIKKIKEI
jgi:hypothetical protein